MVCTEAIAEGFWPPYVERRHGGSRHLLFPTGLVNLSAPPVQPQHGVAYLVHESSSSGEECALRIRQYHVLELPWTPQG
jgi:hypothetical protein